MLGGHEDDIGNFGALLFPARYTGKMVQAQGLNGSPDLGDQQLVVVVQLLLTGALQHGGVFARGQSHGEISYFRPAAPSWAGLLEGHTAWRASLEVGDFSPGSCKLTRQRKELGQQFGHASVQTPSRVLLMQWALVWRSYSN